MKPKARQNDIVIQELTDEVLIYNTITNKAINLNKTAASVWNLCDGNRDVAEINKVLAKDQRLAVSRYGLADPRKTEATRFIDQLIGTA